MKLFTNGCSYTWGGEIIDNQFFCEEQTADLSQHTFREKNVFSGLLHEKLQTQSYNNLAICGGSNQRIVRTTLDFFIDLLKKGQDLSNYIAVIQWTVINRFEIFSDWRNDYFNCHSNLDVDESHRLHPIMEKNIIEFYNSRRTIHPQNFENEFIKNIVCLDSFFKLHKIKYVFCQMSDINVSVPYSMCWLGNDCMDASLMNIVGLNTYPKLHPNLKGHEIIAERIYNRLKELYNL